MSLTLYRKAHFNAAHRLFRKEWSDEKNLEVFGKCSNPHYHGHNYELVVGISGDVNPETGFMMNLKELKQIIYNEVEIPFDHKNLNIEVAEFANLNPTVENITIVIWNRLRKHITDSLKITVTLYETSNNFATYNGPHE